MLNSASGFRVCFCLSETGSHATQAGGAWMTLNSHLHLPSVTIAGMRRESRVSLGNPGSWGKGIWGNGTAPAATGTALGKPL